MVQAGPDPSWPDIGDARFAMNAVGNQPRLAAGERPGSLPAVHKGHGEQRRRDGFPHAEQGIQSAWVRLVGNAGCKFAQLVCGVSHGRHHCNHLVSRLARLGYPAGGPANAGGVGY